MGILLIGLLGVGAMIPAGRFEVLQGAKIDHASAVGRQAFRDLKVRGYLNPVNWRDAAGGVYYNAPDVNHATNWFGTNNAANNPPGLTPVVVIDPLGLLIVPVANSFSATFPYGSAGPALTRICDRTHNGSLQIADTVFRSGDDLVVGPSPQGKDYPATQSSYYIDTGTGNSSVHQPLASPLSSEYPAKRFSEGNYSWLATIVTDPRSSALRDKVTVSVAVFYKRDFANPQAAESSTTRVVAVPSSQPGGQSLPAAGGGEMVFYYPPTALPVKPVKPGQWIMLAGITYAGIGAAATPQFHFRWYRVVAASDLVDQSDWTGPAVPGGLLSPCKLQNVTLAGPDWVAFPAAGTNLNVSAPNVPWPTVWIIDNVVAVYEKNLKLEIQ